MACDFVQMLFQHIKTSIMTALSMVTHDDGPLAD